MIALYSPVLEANPAIEPYAQGRLKVKATLAKDSASLGAFRYLEKLHCMVRLTSSSSDPLTTEYGSLYNHLYRLPRLITQVALTQSFQAIESRLAGFGMLGSRSKTRFADPLTVCHNPYEERRASRQHYIALVF